MTENRLRLPTYNQVWRLERMIYRIERVSLPFPVTVSQIGVFVGALTFMVVLSALKPVMMLPATARYALIPGLFTWYLTRQSLDGKPPHLWVATMAGYLLGPRRLGGFAPLSGLRRYRVRPVIAYRIGPPSAEVQNDGGTLHGLSDSIL
jgi:hypothetical protein